MKKIISAVGYQSTEHFVIDVGSEPVEIDFVQQVDDIMISSPDGDVFISWDNINFSPENCLLIKSADNLKEIALSRCTHFYIQSADANKTVRVYVTGQRN